MPKSKKSWFKNKMSPAATRKLAKNRAVPVFVEQSAPRAAKRVPAKKRTSKQLLASATDRVRQLTDELADFKRKAGKKLVEDGELVTTVRDLNKEVSRLHGELQKQRDEAGTGPTVMELTVRLNAALEQNRTTRCRTDVLIDALAAVMAGAGLKAEPGFGPAV